LCALKAGDEEIGGLASSSCSRRESRQEIRTLCGESAAYDENWR